MYVLAWYEVSTLDGGASHMPCPCYLCSLPEADDKPLPIRSRRSPRLRLSLPTVFLQQTGLRCALRVVHIVSNTIEIVLREWKSFHAFRRWWTTLFFKYARNFTRSDAPGKVDCIRPWSRIFFQVSSVYPLIVFSQRQDPLVPLRRVKNVLKSFERVFQ